MNVDDNDDVPWGTDPAGADDTAPQSESNQLPAGERPNPFLRVTPLVPAAAASAGAAKTPAPPGARRMSRRALLTGFAVLTVAAVLVAVNGSNSAHTGPTAPPVSAVPPSSSPAPTSAVPVIVTPVLSISRITATVTTTATTTATATTRITAAPVGGAPVGGAPTRLSVSASGSAVPGGVAVTASVDTDGGPVAVLVHVSGPQGNQQFAVRRAAAGSGTYSSTVHTGVGVVAVTVSATAGTRSASSAPFTVRVLS